MSVDAVVIGAGVIGSAVALELSRQGRAVVCVDALPAAGYGSTSSSSAVVRFNYSTRSGVAMAWEGVHYWTNWADHVRPEPGEPIVDFTEVPMLMLERDGDPAWTWLAHFDHLGVPWERIDRREAEHRFGWIDLRTFGPPEPLAAMNADVSTGFWSEDHGHHTSVIVTPRSGYVSDPQLAAANLADAARRSGADFRFGVKVVEVATMGGEQRRVTGVTLDDGATIDTPVVVNVAGPHSSMVNRLAGITAEVTVAPRALRREVFVVPAPAGVDFEATGAMIGDLDCGIYLRPEGGNNVLIGSAEPDCDVLEWVDDADEYDRSLDEDEYQLLALRASRRISDLPIPATKRGVCDLYDATPDWTPIYDRSSVDGWYMACGSSGNQFKNAAVAGWCMAELISAVEAGQDHDHEPVQLAGRHTGATIDMSTFRRSRVLTEHSAATVLG